MRFKRLLSVEAEKLYKAPVFWVAPIVAVLYLALMLAGYEVYAAKNGVNPAAGAIMSNRYSGSVVVYAYSTAKHMVENVFSFMREAKGSILRPPANEDLPLDERPFMGGERGRQTDFNFLGTLLHSLANPKPMPSSPCDCPCDKVDKSLVPHSASPGEAWLIGLFVGTAAAAEVSSPPPPPSRPEDSFMERLAVRIHWLTDSTSLESKLIDRARFNGLRFTYLSFYFAFIFIFPALVVAVTAQVFAQELNRGTIKTSLLMPIERWQLLVAKMVVVGGYLLGAVAGFLLLTLGIGCLFAGYGNLVLDSELIGVVGGNSMIKGDGAVMLFAAAVPVATLSLLPVAAVAAWLSFIKPEPAWVISISIISYFIFYALGETPLFEDLRFLFPTTYMDGWGMLFQTPLNTSALSFKLAVSGLLGMGVLVAAARKLSRLDIGA